MRGLSEYSPTSVSWEFILLTPRREQTALNSGKGSHGVLRLRSLTTLPVGAPGIYFQIWCVLPRANNSERVSFQHIPLDNHNTDKAA
jgi:hypothetical protein